MVLSNLTKMPAQWLNKKNKAIEKNIHINTILNCWDSFTGNFHPFFAKQKQCSYVKDVPFSFHITKLLMAEKIPMIVKTIVNKKRTRTCQACSVGVIWGYLQWSPVLYTICWNVCQDILISNSFRQAKISLVVSLGLLLTFPGRFLATWGDTLDVLLWTFLHFLIMLCWKWHLKLLGYDFAAF